MNKITDLAHEFIDNHDDYKKMSHSDIIDNLMFFLPNLAYKQVIDVAIKIEELKDNPIPTNDDIFDHYVKFSNEPLIDDDYD